LTIPAARLSIENVRVEANARALVEGISLDVRPGEVLGLIGPNGAGKSSLLRTIYHVNRPIVGRVLVNGEDVWLRGATWTARHVGAVLQDVPADFPLTVTDIIAMGRSAHKGYFAGDTPHDLGLIRSAISLLDLDALANRLFRTLSGGERQRVLLARAVVQQPGLLVLDEPTNHLDLKYQVSLLGFVRDFGVTVVAALHDLTLAAMFCDRLALMDGGRLVALGRPAEVLTPDMIALVYGLDTMILRHPARGTVVVMPV